MTPIYKPLQTSLTVALMGSSGLLGKRLENELVLCGFNVVPSRTNNVQSSKIDFRVWDETQIFLTKASPDIIINLVALTNVDECERNPRSAYLLNVLPVENIVRWMQANNPGCHLIQISTDQVYDGTGPHGENDIQINNIYAMTKYKAEQVAKKVNATIFRTNFFGKSQTPGRDSITDWIYKSVTSGMKISVFDDIRFSPISIKTLMKIIVNTCFERWDGTYNLGAKNGLTKAEFSYAFVRAFGGDLRLLKSIDSRSSSMLDAYRPKDMTMRVDFFEAISGFKFQNMEDEILIASKEYQ